MSTSEKIKVLYMFAHSRLIGKYTSDIKDDNVIVNSKEQSLFLKNSAKNLQINLESKMFTIDNLNNLSSSPYFAYDVFLLQSTSG